MDILKVIGVIIGATVLAVGLWQRIGLLTALGFIIMAVSMIMVATTRPTGATGESDRPYH